MAAKLKSKTEDYLRVQQAHPGEEPSILKDPEGSAIEQDQNAMNAYFQRFFEQQKWLQSHSLFENKEAVVGAWKQIHVNNPHVEKALDSYNSMYNH